MWSSCCQNVLCRFIGSHLLQCGCCDILHFISCPWTRWIFPLIRNGMNGITRHRYQRDDDDDGKVDGDYGLSISSDDELGGNDCTENGMKIKDSTKRHCRRWRRRSSTLSTHSNVELVVESRTSMDAIEGEMDGNHGIDGIEIKNDSKNGGHQHMFIIGALSDELSDDEADDPELGNWELTNTTVPIEGDGGEGHTNGTTVC